MAKLIIGDLAPEFELLNQDGEEKKLSDYLGGKTLVLYFYPKDETPGCVKEACAFRDQYQDFQDAGATVVGISADKVDSHKLFRLSRSLPFDLLSDPQNTARKAYGVSSSMLGFIPGRETFVIDKYGKIHLRFASQTQILSHIREALTVVKMLNGDRKGVEQMKAEESGKQDD